MKKNFFFALFPFLYSHACISVCIQCIKSTNSVYVCLVLAKACEYENYKDYKNKCFLLHPPLWNIMCLPPDIAYKQMEWHFSEVGWKVLTSQFWKIIFLCSATNYWNRTFDTTNLKNYEDILSSILSMHVIVKFGGCVQSRNGDNRCLISFKGHQTIVVLYYRWDIEGDGLQTVIRLAVLVLQTPMLNVQIWRDQNLLAAAINRNELDTDTWA